MSAQARLEMLLAERGLIPPRRERRGVFTIDAGFSVFNVARNRSVAEQVRNVCAIISGIDSLYSEVGGEAEVALAMEEAVKHDYSQLVLRVMLQLSSSSKEVSATLHSFVGDGKIGPRLTSIRAPRGAATEMVLNILNWKDLSTNDQHLQNVLKAVREFLSRPQPRRIEAPLRILIGFKRGEAPSKIGSEETNP